MLNETQNHLRAIARDFRTGTDLTIRECIELAVDHETPYSQHIDYRRIKTPMHAMWR